MFGAHLPPAARVAKNRARCASCGLAPPTDHVHLNAIARASLAKWRQWVQQNQRGMPTLVTRTCNGDLPCLRTYAPNKTGPCRLGCQKKEACCTLTPRSACLTHSPAQTLRCVVAVCCAKPSPCQLSVYTAARLGKYTWGGCSTHCSLICFVHLCKGKVSPHVAVVFSCRALDK